MHPEELCRPAPAAGTHPWGEVFGLAAVLCALWVCGIAWEAATTPPSPCGNCRSDLAAQAALVEEAPWFLLAAVVGWLGASRCAGPGVRVARCAFAVAVVLWCASFGFVHHWW
jgi:hypothetical protein